MVHFRRDFGLPLDFRINWVHKFPQHFEVVKLGDEDGGEYLELVSWNPRKDSRFNGGMGSQARYALTGFPHEVFSVIQERYRGKIEHFQKRSFLSPYADACGLEAGSKEFDKRAIAVMHELLSFTLGKRLVTDHLIHFRKEFVISEEADADFFNFFGSIVVSSMSLREGRESVCA